MTSEERHILGQHRDNGDHTARRADSEATVQLREEELAARKQSVEAGRVSLGTELVEEEQTIEVPVTREVVSVERRRVDRRPTDGPITATSDVVRVPVREDQISVDKQAVVYEEVNVGKRSVQETQRVSDTVRKEVVDVDVTGHSEISAGPDEPR